MQNVIKYFPNQYAVHGCSVSLNENDISLIIENCKQQLRNNSQKIIQTEALLIDNVIGEIGSIGIEIKVFYNNCSLNGGLTHIKVLAGFADIKI